MNMHPYYFSACILHCIVPRVAPEVVSTIPDQRSIIVSWLMLECQDRLGFTTMYEVRYSIFGESAYQTLNTSYGNETSLFLPGLEEFTNYTIEVRAYTSVGPGPYSDPVDVQTLEDCKHNYCVCMLKDVVYVCASVNVLTDRCITIFFAYKRCLKS